MVIKPKAISEYKGLVPNTSPLIEGLVESPTLTLIFAPSGGMKSLFALDLARSVATGSSFLGLPTRKAPVLYIDAEMSAKSISQRGEAMGISEVPVSDLGYLTPSDCESFDLLEKTNQEKLLAYLKESDHELIVFDNLRTLFSLVDENDACQFTEINSFLIKIRGMGKSAIILHHANKGAEAYSGSTNIETPYDSIFGLLATQEDNSVKKITVKKNRNGLEEFQGLDQQYVAFSGAKFLLNSIGASAAEKTKEILSELERGSYSTIKDLAIAFQDAGVISKGGQFYTYPGLWKEIHGLIDSENFRSIQDIKDAIKKSRK